MLTKFTMDMPPLPMRPGGATRWYASAVLLVSCGWNDGTAEGASSGGGAVAAAYTS